MTDITMARGDTNIWTFAVTRKDANGIPQPVNLTGAKLWFTLKRNRGDADPGVVQKSSPSSGITITNAAGGLGAVLLSPSDTAALDDGLQLLFDLQLKEVDATITTLEEGIATIEGDVTVTTT